MPVIFIDPLSDPSYDQFINSHPDSTFFHSSDWARVLHETYGFKPNSITLMENGRVCGLLPFMETQSFFGKRRCVSLPFSDFCEPLFKDRNDFQQAFNTLTRHARTKKWQFILLRGSREFLYDQQPSETIFTHDIDLTQDENKLFHSFRNSTQRNIWKAEKSGVSITHETTLDATKEFFRLNCLTRREHGLPPQPWSFFKNLQTNVLSKGMGFVSLASYQGKPVVGNLFLIFNKKSIFKYGASDKRYQQLRPSNLAMWEGILRCKALGASSLNLGRTELHHLGLLQFKRGLGCSEKKTYYFRYHCKSSSFEKDCEKIDNGFSTKVFRHSPFFILRLFGKLSYKYAY
jgi:lipid II:glycine glycyltransferase (peptidoglycan interpeptide bridge formation enzyme)